MKIILVAISLLSLFELVNANQNNIYQNARVYPLIDDYECAHQGGNIFSRKVYLKNGKKYQATDCSPTPNDNLEAITCSENPFDHDIAAGRSWSMIKMRVKDSGEILGDCFRSQSTAAFEHQINFNDEVCPNEFDDQTVQEIQKGIPYFESEGQRINATDQCQIITKSPLQVELDICELNNSKYSHGMNLSYYNKIDFVNYGTNKQFKQYIGNCKVNTEIAFEHQKDIDDQVCPNQANTQTKEELIMGYPYFNDQSQKIIVNQNCVEVSKSPLELEYVSCQIAGSDYTHGENLSYKNMQAFAKYGNNKQFESNIGDCTAKVDQVFEHILQADSSCAETFDTNKFVAVVNGKKYINVDNQKLIVSDQCYKVSEYNVPSTFKSETSITSYLSLDSNYREKLATLTGKILPSSNNQCDRYSNCGDDFGYFTYGGPTNFYDSSPVFTKYDNLKDISNFSYAAWVKMGDSIKITKNYYLYSHKGKEYKKYEYADVEVSGILPEYSVRCYSNDNNGYCNGSFNWPAKTIKKRFFLNFNGDLL